MKDFYHQLQNLDKMNLQKFISFTNMCLQLKFKFNNNLFNKS